MGTLESDVMVPMLTVLRLPGKQTSLSEGDCHVACAAFRPRQSLPSPVSQCWFKRVHRPLHWCIAAGIQAGGVLVLLQAGLA